MFLYLKALHIVFVVTWFAGLFYMVRLLAYYAETFEQTETERQVLQPYLLASQRRLWYGITFPSAIVTAILGGGLLYSYGGIPDWLWVKLGLVAGLYAYHFSCHYVFLQQQQGLVRYSGFQLRIWNEVATLFLVSIVFLVILKNTLDMIWGVLGLVALMALLMVGILWYKKKRHAQS